jgi:hypothetical protein
MTMSGLSPGIKSCVSDYKKYYAEHGAEFAKNNLPASAESSKLMTCWAVLINGLLDRNYDVVQGIDYAIAVIGFQIAELHRMAGKQLENEDRYFDIDSETGNRWYNFDPHTNLECGARGLGFAGTDEEDEAPETVDYSWRLPGELLETGRY